MTIRARQVRELALQLLFTFDALNNADSETAMQVTLDAAPDDVAVRTRAVEAANAAWAYRKQADAWLERLAPQWPPHRQPAMDRAILRYALYELTATDIPPKVVLDEAIELAKLYSTADSGAFVNGLLDAALKEITELKVVATPEE